MNYEEIIEKIEDILEEGKPSFGGGGKIKIDGDAIYDCLKELSSSIPTEIIQARKIVAERREILQAAQETAGKIVSDAQANADAQEREESAKRWAYEMRTSASEFAKSIMGECDEYLTRDIEHYTRSQENVRLALSRLQNVSIKRPDDED